MREPYDWKGTPAFMLDDVTVTLVSTVAEADRSADMPSAGIVRRLVVHRPPALVLACPAVQHRMPETATTCSCFLGRNTDAGRPGHLKLARLQFMPERTY